MAVLQVVACRGCGSEVPGVDNFCRGEVEITEGTLFRVQANGGLMFGALAALLSELRSTTSAPATPSLVRLEELPLRTLKIDRAFISGVNENGLVKTDLRQSWKPS